MIKVQAIQDEEGHWYLVPNELIDEFHRLLNSQDYDKFMSKFGKLYIGGDLNDVQLYIEK